MDSNAKSGSACGVRWTIKLGPLWALVLVASGCAHSVHQVYVSAMDSKATYGKGRWVQVETQDFVILSFAAQTNYIETAYRELQDKCPGRIAQVTSEHLTSFKFLSYDQKLILRGLCQT